MPRDYEKPFRSGGSQAWKSKTRTPPARGREPVRQPGRAGIDEPVQIFGSHAVEAVLANPLRVIRGLWLTENAERRLAPLVGSRGFAVERVTPRDLDRRLGADTVHQGALVEADPLPDVEIADLARLAVGGRPVIVLDQVTDPHNVGAVMRSAAAFGAAGLVLTRRHSPPLAGVLAKSASGALETVPVALVGNLSQALLALRAEAFVVIGLDGTGETCLEDEPAHGLIALVFGAEGKGLRQLTRETCDRVCRLHTDGAIASLNVSNAAAVSLHYLALARRPS
jgi:23S rRNA (guanosine2251-2'-O)-methyltransferase